MRSGWVATMTLVITGLSAFPAAAAEETPRDVNTHHLFTPPGSRREWEARAESLRKRILFCAGLYPMPERNALNPRVTGRIEGPDYSIENVAIETLPGFYLCGNLYRPKGKCGPFPAIVNPHGHWEHGRLEMQPEVPVAAVFPAPPGEGRGNFVALGVNLAQQGFVVFAYDMVGYNDTNQVDHKFATGLQPWLWNVSLLGLQLWNSIRALDYLESLPEVDRKRLGATGASGGGTQTFLLSAVDARIKAAVPVNMISAHMQGGCLCENGPGLRVGTDNVELGAMMAPRPLRLVAATGDWTKDNPTEEWPAIRHIYELKGAAGRTDVRQFNYKHNYNVESRQAMYAWFGQYFLKDRNSEHFLEQPLDPQFDITRLHVWNSRQPRPDNALKEPELIKLLIGNSERQLAALWPRDKKSLKHFREIMTPALSMALSVNIEEERSLPFHGGTADILCQQPRKIVLIVAGAGQENTARRLTDACITRGWPAQTLGLNISAKDPEALWAKFFTCYNRAPVGDAVQQIADALQTLKTQSKIKHIRLIALGNAGPAVLLARGLFPSVESSIIDVDQFNNNDDQAYIGRMYAPGLRRCGDLRTAAMLAAPSPLCLHNAGMTFNSEAIATGYSAVGAKLRVEKSMLSEDEIVDWIVRQ